MADDHKFEHQTDRHATLLDFKQRLIDLMANQQLMPESDVYDEPVRYYKMNKAWAKLMSGWIDWMQDVSFWSEAEDDSFSAIQQMLKFEEGITLPELDLDCGDVEDCLESSTIINNIYIDIDNIEQAGNTGGNPANIPQNPTEGSNYETGNDPAFDPDDCGDSDKDKLWGAIDTLVDFCHDTNLDLFQDIASYANKAALLAKVISAIPLVGLLPIDEAVDIAGTLANTLSVEYLANTTTVGLYELKCELFCQAVGVGCSFSVNDLYGYVVSNTGVTGIAEGASFQDYANALGDVLVLSDMEWFCFITAMQLSLAMQGETFVAPYGMKMYTKAAQAGALSGDGGWASWCDECAEHTGAWTVILDFANDYTKTGDEFVYRNVFAKLQAVSGAASLSQQFGNGMQYSTPGGSTINKKLMVLNAGALFKDARINWRKVSGVAAIAQVNVGSNLYSPPNNTTGSTIFFWDSYKPLRGVGSPVGSISQLNIQFGQQLFSQNVVIYVRYIELRGTGELPKFG